MIFLVQFEIKKHLLIFQRPQILLVLEKFKIMLIIKEIIIAKCQNCLVTQTCRVYNPSSV